MNHPSYVKCLGNLVFLMTALASGAVAGEKAIASLHDMSDVELKETGFTMQIGAPVHIKAVGAGGDYGWTYKSGGQDLEGEKRSDARRRHQSPRGIV